MEIPILSLLKVFIWADGIARPARRVAETRVELESGIEGGDVVGKRHELADRPIGDGLKAATWNERT
jgi:hypothetical protein